MLYICFQSFVKDFEKFHCTIEDMGRRLAKIVCQAFDDCNGLESIFKVSAFANSNELCHQKRYRLEDDQCVFVASSSWPTYL